VKQFESWPDTVRSFLVTGAQISAEETPFLAYFENASKWTVLTLDRVIWKRGGEVSHVPFSELYDARLPEDVTSRLSTALANATYSEDGVANVSLEAKLQANRLLLISREGNTLIVEFEPGKPFFAFWNVIKMQILQAQPSAPKDR
jgi:hypothetical protein